MKLLCTHTRNEDILLPHTLRSDLVVEHIDNDVLVLDGKSSTVHRFSGSHAEAITRLVAGDSVEACAKELADFDAAGLLDTEAKGSTVSRRGVLLGGSALAGSAALAMSMPTVAGAQSPGGLETITSDSLDFSAIAGGQSADGAIWVASPRIDFNSPDPRFPVGSSWRIRLLGGSNQSTAGFESLDVLSSPSLVVERTGGGFGLDFPNLEFPALSVGALNDLAFQFQLVGETFVTEVLETEVDS